MTQRSGCQKSGRKKWRYSKTTRYHYLEDDRYGYAHIFRSEGVYVAIGKDVSRHRRLRYAKARVEAQF